MVGKCERESRKNCKINVNTFSGATTTCMEDYMKPLQMSSDYFILHIGTTDLGSSKSSQEIVNSIIISIQ